eukprot:6196472-Pleurochrysis_carterae.AAC.2
MPASFVLRGSNTVLGMVMMPFGATSSFGFPWLWPGAPGVLFAGADIANLRSAPRRAERGPRYARTHAEHSIARTTAPSL